MLFFSCQIRTLVAIATYSKKWKLAISAKSLGIFDFLQICLLSSPPRFI